MSKPTAKDVLMNNNLETSTGLADCLKGIDQWASSIKPYEISITTESHTGDKYLVIHHPIVKLRVPLNTKELTSVGYDLLLNKRLFVASK